MESFHQKEIKRFRKLCLRAREKNNLKEESEYCNALGNEYLQLEEYDEALTMHERELALCRTLKDQVGQAVANRKIGDVYSAKDDFTNAIKHHYKYLELAENDNVELQRATTSLGKTYLDFSRTLEDSKKIEENLIESIEFLNKSLRLAGSIGNGVQEREIVEMKIRSLINLGLSHHQLSGVLISGEERSKSENYFQKAIYLSQKHNFKEDLYLAYYVVTSVNLEQKQYTNALRNCQSALSIAEKINDKKSVIEALLLNGQVDLLMGNNLGAKSCFLKAYQMKSKLDRGAIEEQLKLVIKLCRLQDQIKMAESDYIQFRINENMADILCKLQCFDQAVMRYKNQEKLLEKLEPGTLSEKQKRSVYFSIATTLFDIGEYKESKEYHFKELEVTDDKSEQSKTWSYIAACHEKSGESFSVIEGAYNNAVECSVTAEDKRLQLKTLSVFHQAQVRHFQCKDDITSTREKIEVLENDLGMWEGESDEEDVMCENSCQMEDDLDELLQEELKNCEKESEVQIQRGSRRNPKLNKKNDKGETLLHRACIEGDLNRAELLVGQGHDLSPRDYCGWTPLHEACNYGHFEIIKLLVNKGAKVNDVGGDLCQSITPINDAATNGHFDIVDFLLSKGANPNITSTHGTDVLASLKNFYQLHADDMDSESKEMYFNLCKRLKLKQYSQPPDSLELRLVNDQQDNSHKSQSLEANLPTIKKKTKENRSINSILDHGMSFSGEVLEYKESISNLGGSGTRVMTETEDIRSPAVKRRSNAALIPEEENPVDDWLIPVEDVTSQPIKKQRVFDQNVAQSTCNIASKQNRKKITGQFNSKQINKKRKSSKITDFCSSNTADAANLDSFNDDFYEKEKQEVVETHPVLSTHVVYASPPIITQQEKSIFRLKVKIEEITFMVAVTNRSETIGELTVRAAMKYEKVKSREPKLSLFTADDCMLSEEDLIVDVLSHNDLVIGKVDNWHVVKFTEMYKNACKKNGSNVVSMILQACKECELTKIFELTTIVTYEKHLKPLFSIIGLQDIQKIILTGNRIGLEGIKAFCSSMENRIKTNSPLVELDLSLSNIPEESLTHLSNNPILSSLTHLNLSYNPLNNSTKLVSMILKHCGKLQLLNISHCGLNMFNPALLPTMAKFDYLETLDISYNLFGWKGVNNWLKLLNREVVKSLSFKAVANSSSNIKMLNSIHEFIILSETDLAYLGVEENYLTRDHLNQLTLSSNYFELINIANNELDFEDLKDFVNNLPCCNTMWLY